jgi:hypothetical protein
MSGTESPDFDRLAEARQILREGKQQKAEIAGLRAEVDSKSTQIGNLYRVCSEKADLAVQNEKLCVAACRDAETIARLREALTVIADWDRAPITGERRESLLDIIRSICDCARAALAKEPS